MRSIVAIQMGDFKTYKTESEKPESSLLACVRFTSPEAMQESYRRRLVFFLLIKHTLNVLYSRVGKITDRSKNHRSSGSLKLCLYGNCFFFKDVKE